MVARRDKVAVDLDAEIVERTRTDLGVGSGSDASIVERALNAYLLGRLLDVAQAKAALSEADDERLAYQEVRGAP
jgi:hypothetical protein